MAHTEKVYKKQAGKKTWGRLGMGKVGRLVYRWQAVKAAGRKVCGRKARRYKGYSTVLQVKALGQQVVGGAHGEWGRFGACGRQLVAGGAGMGTSGKAWAHTVRQKVGIQACHCPGRTHPTPNQSQQQNVQEHNIVGWGTRGKGKAGLPVLQVVGSGRWGHMVVVVAGRHVGGQACFGWQAGGNHAVCPTKTKMHPWILFLSESSQCSSSKLLSHYPVPKKFLVKSKWNK